MGVYTMVVAIVAIVMCLSAFKHWAEAQARKAEAAGAGLDDKAQAKINDLEERVQVLERIATDKGVRLKDEIDAL
jgi:hypothetical protein